MATIVRMPSAREPVLRSGTGERSATILFFTGVRYVRDEDDEDEVSTLQTPPGDTADAQDAAALLLV